LSFRFKRLPPAPPPPPLSHTHSPQDCITAHGPDAHFIAREFYGTASVVKTAGGLPAVALTRPTYEAAVRALLLDRGTHRVQTYEPVPGGGTGGTAWRKVKEGSPGRPGGYEADLYRNADAPDAPPLLAVSLSSGAAAGDRRVGFALVDASRRELAATEFGDDDGYGALEAAAAAAGVREAVVQVDLGAGKGGDAAAAAAATPAAAAAGADAARARAALERAGALVTDAPRAAFLTKELEADLGRLLRSRSVEQHRDVLDRPLAAAALAGALALAEATADAGGLGRWGLRLHDTGAALRLDAAALAALGVVPERGGAGAAFAAPAGAAQAGGAATSLTALLNVGRTPMGRRAGAAWLRAPLVDLAAIRARHDVVEALMTDGGLRAALREGLLRGLPDLERLARKLERRTATLADLCSLYSAAARLEPLVAALKAYDPAGGPPGAEAHATLLASWFADPLARAADPGHLGKFEDLIEAALDLDRVPDEYLVAAAYDAGLQSLRADKEAAEAGVVAAAEAAAAELGLALDKTVKLEWFKPGGVGGGGGSASGARVRCLRLTATEERRVRTKLGGPAYTLLETRKDGTKFTCRPLRLAADGLAVADAAYARRQAALADQVVAVASTFCDVWAHVGRLVGELDALAGFAAAGAAAPLPYVRPTMAPAEGGVFELSGLRHPVVEALAGVDFVPNDCVLVKKGSPDGDAAASTTHPDAAWFAVVTGPNMGGKSTFIRSAGLAVVMAQAGCFVPATSATIPVRDAVFARVGAGDCQARGVSTFMAEMLETASILRGASAASLVIVDELGRGTSTYDGFGLAWAISEHLMAGIGCPTLFATHFHELTALDGPGGVANWHVETAVESGEGAGGGSAKKRLTMLYRVAPGPCDQSFGIHVAEVAGFPPAVVEAARVRAAALEDFSGGGGGGQPAAKKARVGEEEDEVAARARAFLTALAGLEGEGEAALAGAQALVEGLAADAASNPALRALVA